MSDIQISISKDTASAALLRLANALGSNIALINDRVGKQFVQDIRSDLLKNPTNKQGWPSTGFWQATASATDYSVSRDGFTITIDNPNAPGAVKHFWNGGKTGKIYIQSNGEPLTIPARADFYGHRATEFGNLRFGMFANGTKFLYIWTGGATRGKSVVRGIKNDRSTTGGAGARSAMMIAFWLVPSVEQNAMPDVIPSREQLISRADKLFRMAVDHLVGGQN